MPKEIETAPASCRPSHRTYTPEFKAQLVAQCLRSGVSIAALALQHAMNANVLHRWLKEHQRSGRHALDGAHPRGVQATPSNAPAFIPLQLTTVTNPPVPQQIKVELRKGTLSLNITWPTHAAADFASWTAAILK